MGVTTTNGSNRHLQLKEWPTRRITLLVLPGIHLTSLAGPVDAFTRASAALTRSGKRRSAAYELQLLTEDRKPLAMGHGLEITGAVS